METRDPDDALTLCLLATHPAIELVAVSLTPGTGPQIAIAREILCRLGCEVPIGARHPGSDAEAVSRFHRDWLGPLPTARPDGIAHDVLADALTSRGTCLLTGAPLANLRLLLRHHPEITVDLWVAQGGFAGDNLVAPEQRLAKFTGRLTCESHNFGGDKKGAFAALGSPRIRERRLVGKNVTHAFAWDRALHERLDGIAQPTAGLALVYAAMDLYLQRHPEGKLLHDALAACAMVDAAVFRWSEVEVIYAKGQWGARPQTGTGTHIAVGLDSERALKALIAPATLPSRGAP